MPNFASATIIGHLGQDPETRFSPSGTQFCTFSVAVNNGTRDAEHTDWFRVTAFGRLAETCAQYLRKGAPVMIQGRLKSSTFTARDGTQRWSMELTATEMLLLGSRDGGKEAHDADDDPIPF